ncbi:ComF family protein [Crassaminicella thermophila]|uniref:ComF family protein n=1 Tax=Crassaminicella thermophila TaxID=2599308 RepID=A0A5C0S9S5_CRATE|nr:ComF family protein [Crassaminicella thermophila]QEK11303.1 ComF family protein [Crassaminicella thermophila]
MKYKTASLYIDTLLDFLYPRNIYCIVCKKGIKKTQKYSLCKSCYEKIKFIDLCACEKCGKPLEKLYLPTKCPDCLKTEHIFTKAFSCVVYDDNMKQLVHRLKYGKERYIAYHMAEIMVDKLKKEGLSEIDFVIPVPLHKRKERERGFNQAYLLAKYIGKAMDWNADRKNLVKIKETLSQNQLSKDERKKNLKNVFSVVSKDIYKGKTILMVDDVYTTGNTIDACSKEILKASPKNIFVISFATGKNT